MNWNALAQLSGTLVLLMAVERIELFAETLRKGGRPAQTPVLAVQHGTTAGEAGASGRRWPTWPKTSATEGIRPPAIIVIGPVAPSRPYRDFKVLLILL